ncbi:MAG TPA: hypothetical protein PK983_11390, partial [Syntrophales bacterium]|nr:hypothetical protein [Syntrophales bacterium]
NAILAASVCGEYYPVKIVVGKTPGGGHAQARCKIEGRWEWLQVRNEEVYVGVEEGPFVDERRDMSIESYMQLMDVSYPIVRGSDEIRDQAPIHRQRYFLTRNGIIKTLRRGGG